MCCGHQPGRLQMPYGGKVSTEVGEKGERYLSLHRMHTAVSSLTPPQQQLTHTQPQAGGAHALLKHTSTHTDTVAAGRYCTYCKHITHEDGGPRHYCIGTLLQRGRVRAVERAASLGWWSVPSRSVSRRKNAVSHTIGRQAHAVFVWLWSWFSAGLAVGAGGEGQAGPEGREREPGEERAWGGGRDTSQAGCHTPRPPFDTPLPRHGARIGPPGRSVSLLVLVVSTRGVVVVVLSRLQAVAQSARATPRHAATRRPRCARHRHVQRAASGGSSSPVSSSAHNRSSMVPAGMP